MRFLTVAVTALAAMPLGLADKRRPSLRRPDGGFELKAKFENARIETTPDAETGPRIETTPAQRIKPGEKKCEKKADDTKKKTNTCPVVPILTQKIVCDKLESFADELDAIYDLVKPLQCGETKDYCWIPVRQALYDLEFKLDDFDKLIDQSDLTKCFECRDESKIACCYHRYAESLIATLEIIAEKIEWLDGETAYFIVTAVNSLRAADYTFVYELVRRLQCEKSILEIVEKQGATDGSTPGSIRAAFALFVSTPYITGEEFKVDQGRHGEKPKPCDIEIIDKVKHKNKGKGNDSCHEPPRKHKGKPKTTEQFHEKISN